jgi:hypothetical protein
MTKESNCVVAGMGAAEEAIDVEAGRRNLDDYLSLLKPAVESSSPQA